MIKVRRYSNSGFNSQIQNHHYKKVKLFLLSDEEYIKEMNPKNDYQKTVLLEVKHKREKFLNDNKEDFKEGIWVFIDENITSAQIRFELNHIKGERPAVHFAYFPENTECYDCNFENKGIISDKKFWWCGLYIPKRCLKNIKLRLDKQCYLVYSISR